ncbi:MULTISPECIES: hypothetical protein [unclassified Bartonella]|uniref:hypothetical protein n=1 Tax=unclassified Bartonella TaxID=2645622 RepID=UPI002360551A|nr:MULTISPECIES: hypothetical protein [unclassified Bartonella]
MVGAFGRVYRCGGELLRVAKGFVGHQGEGQVVRLVWGVGDAVCGARRGWS